ncbi:MAG TPA: hypothetical protein VNB94_00590 [Mycobacteriales bacterium]|nr:hypothetical protein [Mycobacteriales bacterium]
MEVLATAVVVLAAACVVLREISAPDRPPHPVPATGQHASLQANPPRSEPPARPPVLVQPRREASYDGTTVLGALGPTEPDRKIRPLRRTTSALMLMVITLAIAGGVGGAIYLGLRRLG